MIPPNAYEAARRSDKVALRPHPLVCVLALAVACGGADRDGAGTVAEAGVGPRPNVILILADTLRADRLGAYGHPGGLTPNLDRIAREGLVVESAISQAPWTQPSIASLFSSVYPGAHGVVNFRTAFEVAYMGRSTLPVFDSSFTTVAEVLAGAGYLTAAFVANPFVAREFGFGQGFQHFDASFAMNTTPGARVNEAALAWLDESDQRPFFLYLHYMDVHGPYNAEPRFLDPLLEAVEAKPERRDLTEEEYRELGYLLRIAPEAQESERHRALERTLDYWEARYEAGIAQLDYYVGALRDALAERGLWDDTYLIFTSDHGEALLEHGFWDHGFSVDHAEVHVPLLLRWPEAVAAESRLESVVRLIDVMPTLVDHLGLPPVPDVQGASLVPQLTGPETPAPGTWALTEAVKAGPERKAIYRGPYKLMRVNLGRDRLIDRHSDPGELADATAAAPQALAELRELLREQLEDNERRKETVETEVRSLSGQLERRLEALGYLVE